MRDCPVCETMTTVCRRRLRTKSVMISIIDHWSCANCIYKQMSARQRRIQRCVDGPDIRRWKWNAVHLVTIIVIVSFCATNSHRPGLARRYAEGKGATKKRQTATTANSGRHGLPIIWINNRTERNNKIRHTFSAKSSGYESEQMIIAKRNRSIWEHLMCAQKKNKSKNNSGPNGSCDFKPETDQHKVGTKSNRHAQFASHTHTKAGEWARARHIAPDTSQQATSAQTKTKLN